MKKYPKGSGIRLFLRRLLGGAIIAESIAFVGTYYVYNRMNHDRDYRYYMSKNCNPILELYYQIGEFGNPRIKTREQDRLTWTLTENNHTSLEK